MLEYDGDVENTFMQTFKIDYKDVFGCVLSHELKDRGDQIPVTTQNRQVCSFLKWCICVQKVFLCCHTLKMFESYFFKCLHLCSHTYKGVDYYLCCLRCSNLSSFNFSSIISVTFCAFGCTCIYLQ